MTPLELRTLSSERMGDAETLLQDGRFSGAIYLAGYSIECSLKARICDLLDWTEYKIDGNYKAMKSHDFVFLLSYSGRRSAVLSPSGQVDWETVRSWRPEIRYDAPSVSTAPSANEYLASARRILQLL